MSDEVNSAIADLRMSGAKFMGVPDVIDDYQSIIGIKQSLNDMEQRLINVINHGHAISTGADIWIRITYIAQQYYGFQTLTVPKKSFAKRLSGRDFHYLLTAFSNLVRGAVFGQQSDWVTSYKKHVASESVSQVCRIGYVDRTAAMRKNIKAIDQVVTEAWLWTLRLTIETQPFDKQVFFFSCLKMDNRII